MSKKKIIVLGAGSWGTALAINCSRVNGQIVYLWGHKKEHINQISKTKYNHDYLPEINIPDNIIPTFDISVCQDCDMILLVVPSFAFRETIKLIEPYYSNQEIGWAIKGFDKTTNNLLSDTFTELLPKHDYAIISGPSFAKEVAMGLPTAVTIASNKIDFANQYAKYLHNKNLRTYTTNDVIGSQIGGALKNVIAITTGISDGLGFGANTRAAIVTRGLTEINRIAQKAGGNIETIMGLSGLGDLMLTCTDDLSRNRRFGLLLGQGHSIDSALKIIGQTVEGLNTAIEAKIYAEKYKVRSPIIDVIESIVTKRIGIEEAMTMLLSHKPKQEID